MPQPDDTPTPEPQARPGRMLMSASRRLQWAAFGWLTGAAVSTLLLTSVMIDSEDFEELASTDSLGTEMADMLPIGILFVAQLPLWTGMLGTAVLARRHGLDWHGQLGWRIRSIDAPIGIGVGVLLQLAALPLLYKPIFWISNAGDRAGVTADDVRRSAENLVGAARTPLEVATLVLMVVVIAPLVEEVFYRGLLQGALQDRFGAATALGGASLIFAATHFQMLQFPALLLVGLVHGFMSLRLKRLGAPVISHISFNALTVIHLL